MFLTISDKRHFQSSILPLVPQRRSHCRMNRKHFKEFSHPGDSSYEEVDQEGDSEEEDEEMGAGDSGKTKKLSENKGTSYTDVGETLSPLFLTFVDFLLSFSDIPGASRIKTCDKSHIKKSSGVKYISDNKIG